MLREILIEELRNGFDKRSWHGANLIGALRGVRPKLAARSVHGRKSIWQQLLHAAYWKHRALTYLGSTEPFPRKGSDWPRIPAKVDLATWKADREMLRELQRALVRAVTTLPEKKLKQARVRWLLHGAAAHDVYHAGQIKLLRRLVR